MRHGLDIPRNGVLGIYVYSYFKNIFRFQQFTVYNATKVGIGLIHCKDLKMIYDMRMITKF